MEINLEDINFEPEQTNEVVEEVTEELEEISTEQTNDDEILEEDSEEVIDEESEEPTEVRGFDDIEIKFQDDERTKLSDFTDEEIARYMQLGEKAEFQIEKTNVKAQETVRDFNNVAEAYGIDTTELLDQLMNQIFEGKSQEPGGKDEGRHIDDIKKEYKSTNKGFKERSIAGLLDTYPELTADTIPKEVLNDLKFGKDINDSYEKYELKTKSEDLETKLAKVEKELKVLKQNASSKKKAFVKPKSGQTDKTGSTLMNEIDGILSHK